MRRFALAALLALAACGKTQAPAPHQIHIVGSSAGFPFSSMAAERLMREDATAIAPLVRAGGSGEGIARFCDGLGRLHPDIVIAARPMTPSETQHCAANGVTRIAMVPIGFTAFVLATAKPGAAWPLTRAALTAALTTRARTWSDVDPALPTAPIRIVGPAPDPAIADGLYDRLLVAGASRIRHDAGYTGYGADAERVARDIADTPGTIGILPYAQAWQHRSTLRLLPLDGVDPTPQTIASGRYPASATLLLLVKADEAAHVPALPRLLGYYAEGLGAAGTFAAQGLVPLADSASAARRLTAISSP
jgi:phosphate transport system substrate-binding protein